MATIQDSKINGNGGKDFGGISISAGSIVMTNCNISNNTAAIYGGGILVENATIVLVGCLISTPRKTFMPPAKK